MPLNTIPAPFISKTALITGEALPIPFHCCMQVKADPERKIIGQRVPA